MERTKLSREFQTEPTEIQRRLLSWRIVLVMVGLSRTTVWRLVRSGEFPKPVQISAGRVAFVADDIERWIASKLEIRQPLAPPNERRATSR